MTDKASKFISSYVQSVVNDNKEHFEEILLNGVTSEMDKDRIFVKMINNSISLSTNIAVQIILNLLDDSNVLPITSDEHLLQKLSLKLYTDISES